MRYIVYIKIVCLICVSGSDIFHENSKVTFYPNYVRSEYFGYSVMLNRYGLIVGAPKATNKERSITSGQVFNCSLSELGHKNISCAPVPISGRDQYPLRLRSRMPNSLFQSDMWFGATIGALTDGKLFICAPRNVEPYNDKHLLANGICYLRKKDRDLVVYPLKSSTRQAFRTDGLRREFGEYGEHLSFYAYGQAGMSMKVTGDNHVIIGAPGLLQWAGGVVSYAYSPDDISPNLSQEAISNPYFTKELGPDNYFGYSVESGVFEKNGSMLYVGGAPRSSRGLGEVLVFEPAVHEQDSLNIRAKVRGPQVGSYFGASLCSLDIDNDGAADLLVGAPNYAEKSSGLPYDQGAVYVYMSKQAGSSFILEASDPVKGSGESGARFGTTIADLGDVDGDGYRDVAIAAPWENEGRGVVYIYRGYVTYSSRGLRSKYNQRILAEGALSFGISISKGLDVDGNHCNDLAIGAAASATVYLYRCIPTVLARAYVQVPDAMNLPHNATGFTALFCVSLNPEPQWPHVKLPFKARITIDQEGNRAKISGDSEYTIVGTPGFTKCDEQTVEVKPTADLSKPISIKFELEPDELLKNDSMEFNTQAARASDKSVLDTNFLIQLVRDCGEDMICIPWLVMTLEALEKVTASTSSCLDHVYTSSERVRAGTVRATAVDSQLSDHYAVRVEVQCAPRARAASSRLARTYSTANIQNFVASVESVDCPYIPGTDAKFGARLTILNKEEPAYGARVNISLPMVPKRLPSPCSFEGWTMTCDVPAPLVRDEDIVWDIELEYNMNTSRDVDLIVTALLEDSLYYRNITKDSMVNMVLYVRPEASFNITGKSLPNATIAVSREKFNEAGNITFLNHIQITNLGPSDWYDLEVHISLDMANLSTPLEGCREEETQLACVWSIPAKVSLPVVLPLWLDLARFGDILEKNSTLNLTTTIFTTWKSQQPRTQFYSSTTITTTLVLDPKPPLWPLIVGAVVGFLLGAALLGLIIYLLHKYGFFSRRQHQRLKELQDMSASSDNGLEETLGAPSTAAATCRSNDSTRELLFEDSD